MTRSVEKRNSLLIKFTLWGLTFVVILPFLWLLKSAGPNYLKNIQALAHTQDGIVFTWLKNSAVFTLGALVTSVLFSITAGFVLAVLDIPFRKPILVITLITMLIPITAMAMPLFVFIDQLHLDNSIAGLIIAGSYYPFGAFLSYLYFSSALPGEVVGMGRIDGLGDWGIFWHLAIPTSKSLWSVVTFFSFITLWNSYQLPSVLLYTPERSTLPMGLQLLYGNGSAIVGILMLVPAVLLYLLSQRSIERGIFSGAVKG